MIARRLLSCVSYFALLSLLSAGASITGAAQSAAASPADEELSRGVDAYKAARYDEAVGHFRKAAELAPDSTTTKQYLATALAQNVVPSLNTPDNLKTAQQAIDVFQPLLIINPNDVNSMKQVAGVYVAIKELDDARTWQKRVLDEDPHDPEAAYTIGVIDWEQAHKNALEALQSVGLQDDGEGNTRAPADLLESIRVTNNASLIDEAMQYLSQAIADRPDYDDAMAYLNLVYAERPIAITGTNAPEAKTWRKRRSGRGKPWRRARRTKSEDSPGRAQTRIDAVGGTSSANGRIPIRSAGIQSTG